MRLVKTGAEGRPLDVIEVNRPNDLSDIADLGLRPDETKRLLAGLQHAAQVREHQANDVHMVFRISEIRFTEEPIRRDP